EARPTAGTDTTQAAGRVVDSAARATPTLTPAPAAVPTQDTARIAEDTVTVSGPLYRYAFSTRGGRLIEATLLKYQSMRPEEKGRPAQILQPGSELLGLSLLIGSDTVSLKDWHFTPSAPSLNLTQPTPLRFTAQRGELSITLNYTFRPDDYLVDV